MDPCVQQSIRDYLDHLDLDKYIGVTLTTKQIVDGIRIDEELSKQNFRHFMNCLNSKVFGKKFERFGVRINVFPVTEYSGSNRLHHHLVMERPEHVPMWLFTDLLKDQWRKTNYGYKQIVIDRHIDTGWINYITKFKTDKDQVDWENVSLDRRV